MTLTTEQTLLSGLITVILVILTGGLFTYFVKRTFNGIDKKIKSLEERLSTSNWVTNSACAERIKSVADLTKASKDSNDSIIRLQEQIKTLEDIKNTLSSVDALKAEFHEKFLRKTDFVRDIQIITSSIETIHKKIDHIDTKIDNKVNGLRGN